MQSTTVPSIKSVMSGGCILCQSKNGEVVYEEAGYTGRRCDCGLVFIDPFPPPALIDPELDQHMESYYSLPARLRVDWLVRHASGKRLLDVGAGNGATVKEALRRGFDVSAIEPNPERAKRLAEAFGIPTQQTIVEEASAEASNYDVVFHIDLLSHFPDPVLALNKMSDMLDPDSGVLCFEVGLFGGMHNNWYRVAGRPGFPQHLWFYSLENIKDLLAQADLELLGCKRFNVSLSTMVSSLLLKFTPGRLRTNTGNEPLYNSKRSVIWRLYHYMHYLLRYRIGGYLPAFGPSTIFIAAVPKNRAVVAAHE